VVYSDGVTESEDPEGQFFGTERLRGILREHPTDGCGELHARIMAAVDQYADGGMMSDDVTLVIIEYLPEAAA